MVPRPPPYRAQPPLAHALPLASVLPATAPAALGSARTSRGSGSPRLDALPLPSRGSASARGAPRRSASQRPGVANEEAAAASSVAASARGSGRASGDATLLGHGGAEAGTLPDVTTASAADFLARIGGLSFAAAASEDEEWRLASASASVAPREDRRLAAVVGDLWGPASAPISEATLKLEKPYSRSLEVGRRYGDFMRELQGHSDDDDSFASSDDSEDRRARPLISNASRRESSRLTILNTECYVANGVGDARGSGGGDGPSVFS